MSGEVARAPDAGHVRTIAEAWRLGAALTGAELSPCRRYRWLLWRIWGAASVVHFIMLNPSAADASLDDPTIRRCVRFADRWGYGGILVTNLYALRSTDPHALWGVKNPVGDLSDEYLRQASIAAVVTVCAWGAQAGWGRLGRSAEVLELLSDVGVAPMVLGFTQEGHPRHPLYLSADREPVCWAPDRSEPSSARRGGRYVR